MDDLPLVPIAGSPLELGTDFIKYFDSVFLQFTYSSCFIVIDCWNHTVLKYNHILTMYHNTESFGFLSMWPFCNSNRCVWTVLFFFPPQIPWLGWWDCTWAQVNFWSRHCVFLLILLIVLNHTECLIKDDNRSLIEFRLNKILYFKAVDHFWPHCKLPVKKIPNHGQIQPRFRNVTRVATCRLILQKFIQCPPGFFSQTKQPHLFQSVPCWLLQIFPFLSFIYAFPAHCSVQDYR